MTKEKKVLLAAALLEIPGWTPAAALLIVTGASRVHAARADNEAATWKRQAGKAYTEMLKAQVGESKIAALIPSSTGSNAR